MEDTMASHYQQHIAELTDTDPALIEGWMRLEYGTLDHLDPVAFRREVRTADQCVAEAGEADSRELARSMGLVVA